MHSRHLYELKLVLEAPKKKKGGDGETNRPRRPPKACVVSRS
jgi:hypothetical protein